MSLTSKHVNFLLKLLNEDTCGSLLTFEQIFVKFQHEISKTDYSRVGNCFVLLLQNRDLIPTIQQRLIIYYLFIQMYKHDEQSIYINPFSSIFLSLLQSNNDYLLKTQKYFHWIITPRTKHECLFIHLLINNNNNKDLFKKTPNEILQLDLTSINDQLQNEQQKKLKEKIDERIEHVPMVAKCHLSAVIDDPEINNYGFDKLLAGSDHLSNSRQETIEKLLLNNCMKQTIHPEYLRLVPPLHEFTLDELIWLEPILNIDKNTDRCLFSWDSSMCLSTSKTSQIRYLMNKAYQCAINFEEQQKILDELNNNPNMFSHIDFSPSKFPLLVENNPLISIECLLKFSSTNSIKDYLLTLVNININLHSIEVVNRLSTTIELPKEFLHLYITTCINTCNQTKDKYLQNRFVRLVSVFIQSLIRNKTIDIKECFNEIETFSINYRNIKETNALYQLLKTFDLYMDNDNHNTHTKTTTSAIENNQ